MDLATTYEFIATYTSSRPTHLYRLNSIIVVNTKHYNIANNLLYYV